MKTFNVYCNGVFKGTYQSIDQSIAIAIAFQDHGDTRHPDGHIGNWTAEVVK